MELGARRSKRDASQDRAPQAEPAIPLAPILFLKAGDLLAMQRHLIQQLPDDSLGRLGGVVPSEVEAHDRSSALEPFLVNRIPGVGQPTVRALPTAGLAEPKAVGMCR
jgi:hypothetical protein